jgi:hypothetical protein
MKLSQRRAPIGQELAEFVRIVALDPHDRGGEESRRRRARRTARWGGLDVIGQSRRCASAVRVLRRVPFAVHIAPTCLS